MSDQKLQVTVGALLCELEAELRRLRLWDESGAPDAAALKSTLPFMVDTLDFPQWLQFVLLPRLGSLIELGAPLPSTSGIHQYAEEFYRGRWGEYRLLIGCLRRLDAALARGE